VRHLRSPVMVALGSVYCCSANCFPRIVLNTHNFSHGGTSLSIQAWLLGSGKAVLNNKQKLVSDRGVVAQNFFCALAGREAMSAMTFSTPGTCIVMSRPALLQWSMTARPRRRWPAVGPLALEAIFSIQLTVGVLSHNVPSSTCLTVGATASAILTAMTSAANSRLEFVRRPSGLLLETTLEVMSCRNADCQTRRDMLYTNENHTPPAPSYAASW
jgi:hypothetical protein